MSDEQLDLNVDNYSIKDLLDILDLNDNEDPNNITDSDYKDILQNIPKEDIQRATEQYIDKFASENNNEMQDFFMEIQTKLFSSIDSNLIDANNINQDETPTKNKITDGDIKFSRYSDGANQLHEGTNGHSVINPETQHIVNTFSPSEVRGNINPLLKNTYSCFMNIDSKYRQFTNNNSETKFTLDLSAPLKNLLSLQLYSYQIPISWYVINSNIGNTCFWIEDSSTNTIVPVTIDPGNYTPDSLVAELNKKILEVGFYDFPTTPFTYDTGKGKVILQLFKGVYRERGRNIFTITEKTKIIFFDFNI
jgi:hypothetical protein